MWLRIHAIHFEITVQIVNGSSIALGIRTVKHAIMTFSKISINHSYPEMGNLFRIIVDANLLLVLDNLEVGCPFFINKISSRRSHEKQAQ